MHALGLTSKYTKSSETFVEHFPGCGTALQISEILLAEKRPAVIVCATIQEAQQLMDELPFFLGKNFDNAIHLFPDWETLPYDTFSPHEDITAHRIKLFATLEKNRRDSYIITASTLLQKLAPKESIVAGTFLLAVGDRFDLEKMRQHLSVLGYQCVTEVMRHGEYAIRGAIMDIFPSNSDLPYRIDLFDNEVDSIRTFAIDDQQSIEKIERIELLPAKEFPMTTASISLFQRQWQEQFSSKCLTCSFYKMVSEGKIFGGIEYYIPLFFDMMSSFFDYLSDDYFVIYNNNLSKSMEQQWAEIKERYTQKSHDIMQPILSPEKLWFTAEGIFAEIKKFERYRFTTPTNKVITDWLPPEFSQTSQNTLPIQPLLIYQSQKNHRILITADSYGRKEMIKSLFIKHHQPLIEIKNWQEFLDSTEKFCIIVAPLWSGIALTEHNITLISENDLYGRKVQQRQQKTTTDTANERVIYQSIAELNLGDPVVHLEHGIGRYLGLQRLTISDQVNEYLAIEYQQGNKLFVPVTNLHLISRYSAGDIQHAPLHTLGSDQWIKARKKALEKAYDVAAELLNIYAQREASRCEAMQLDLEEYEKFCQGFPFAETPDQAQAITAVLQDLHSDRPMDRVICGDVGFGKTEVAIRAAFMALLNQQQTAILVPTTLLAEQHGENFTNRFADWPVKIAVLSRFKSPKEQKAIIDALKCGKIDLVIGTHKLLQEDIGFFKLGLLIIDEEHRFGVRQKEKFKKFKAKVNILTMTATPIPRTLNMAMSKLRDFSIIATPPAKRLSIKTFLFERRRSIIVEAIERELHRGGQVFFLHNNVTTIEHCTAELKIWLPQAHIRFAHGQMSERELETIMIDFYHQRFSVLVCTTIIETGIDIPTANTMIIDRADKLGLAQLHQLRGRVGRSHHQAYAYLLHPDKESLTKDAQKRLNAIASLGDLGAGFQLASHDLEIRGAGELLGEEQSGQMHEVGFSLYLELIEKAVKTLKAGEAPNYQLDFGKENEVDLGLPALIPENYMPDVHSRLLFYKRIAEASSEKILEQLQVEMIDRFGLLPHSIKNLFACNELKIICCALGIKKIAANKKFFKIEFMESTKIEPLTLLKLIQTHPSTYQLLNNNCLKVVFSEHKEHERAEKILAVLTNL